MKLLVILSNKILKIILKNLSVGAGASQQGVQNRTAATGSLHTAEKV
jgi:hypothetical protein